MTQSVQGGFLRDDTTGALVVSGGGGASTASVLHLPYITGRYYSSFLAQTSGSTVGGKAVPYFVTKDQAFDRIACFCTTIGAGSTVRLGIFADNAGVPGTVVVDAGTVDTSGATGVKELTIAQTLTAGLYWLAAVPQGGTTPGLAVANQGATSFQPIGVTAPANSVSNCYGISAAGAFANNPAATVSNSGIIVWLRAA
jgi:hypothetical protein